MPGGLSMLKQLYTYMLGGTNPPGAASASGDVGQMVKWLTANALTSAAMPLQSFAMLPGRRTTPVDVTISGPTTLTERINYFNNLTVSASQTLTGLPGCVLIVEGTLTLGASAIIDCNGFGAAGGTAVTRNGGSGGAPWGAIAGSAGGSSSYPGRVATTGLKAGYVSAQPGGGAPDTIHKAIPWPLADRMADGGAGALGGGGAAGTAGSAYPSTYSSLALPQGWGLVTELLGLLAFTDASNSRYIGGAGGGAGAGGTSAPTAGGEGGSAGWRGVYGTNNQDGSGGGSGFGGGGGGGGANTTGGTGGDGGAGGGVLIIICKAINNAGTLRANGNAGGNASGTNAGGGGGGGGGAVVVAYESASGSGVGTLQANGGAKGNKIGTGGDGGAGGAGLTHSFKVRSGS